MLKYITFSIEFQELFDEYSKCFLVGVDNVGSNQMQQIRTSLRGKGGLFNHSQPANISDSEAFMFLMLFERRVCSCPHGKEHHDPQSHSWTSGQEPTLGKVMFHLPKRILVGFFTI